MDMGQLLRTRVSPEDGVEQGRRGAHLEEQELQDGHGWGTVQGAGVMGEHLGPLPIAQSVTHGVAGMALKPLAPTGTRV